MYIRLIVIFSFLVFSIQANSQTIISQFNWDSGPVSVANVGPNATSVSSSAISDVNGVGGTNGLNASLPKQDLNMIIPGSPTFDVNGIDISFDYQRDESQGTFWQRGSSLIIDGCANISVSYRVSNGAGGFNTVSSGNYPIPNDDIFRRYRFIYVPTTGFGFLLIDGAVVWSNDGPDNRNLYWTGAGNVVVGQLMDGSGSNKTFLDNLVVATVVNSALPIELVEFNAEATAKKQVLTNWITASEVNNDFFTIERSIDGKTWEEASRIQGVGNSSYQNEYEFVDENPFSGISYYRLKQTDFDGRTEIFETKSVFLEPDEEVVVYPNPFSRYCHITDQNVPIAIYTLDGSEVSNLIQQTKTQGFIQMDFEFVQAGIYIIVSGETRKRVVHL